MQVVAAPPVPIIDKLVIYIAKLSNNSPTSFHEWYFGDFYSKNK